MIDPRTYSGFMTRQQCTACGQPLLRPGEPSTVIASQLGTWHPECAPPEPDDDRPQRPLRLMP